MINPESSRRRFDGGRFELRGGREAEQQETYRGSLHCKNSSNFAFLAAEVGSFSNSPTKTYRTLWRLSNARTVGVPSPKCHLSMDKTGTPMLSRTQFSAQSSGLTAATRWKSIPFPSLDLQRI